MNQKDAVYEAIKQLKPGAVDKDTPVVLSKQEKHLVEEKLFDGFRKKKIQYNKDLPSDDKLAMYVSGLVSNWLRKDRRLNGDTNYVPRRSNSTHVASEVHIPPEEMEAIKRMAGPGREVTVVVIRRPEGAGEDKG